MPFDLGPVPDVACVELPFKVSAGYATAGSMPSEALETLGGVAVVGSGAAVVGSSNAGSLPAASPPQVRDSGVPRHAGRTAGKRPRQRLREQPTANNLQHATLAVPSCSEAQPADPVELMEMAAALAATPRTPQLKLALGSHLFAVPLQLLRGAALGRVPDVPV